MIRVGWVISYSLCKRQTECSESTRKEGKIICIEILFLVRYDPKRAIVFTLSDNRGFSKSNHIIIKLVAINHYAVTLLHVTVCSGVIFPYYDRISFEVCVDLWPIYN